MQTDFYADLNNENSTFKLNNFKLSNFNDNQLNPETSSFKMDNIINIPNVNPTRRIMREGWLYKRGEHIRNWRPRYFILYENGDFEGWKQKPDSTMTEPLNRFTVQDCQLLKTEKPKPNTFILRGLQWTSVIERTFYTETKTDRELWCQAIEHVAFLVRESNPNQDQQMDESMDQDMTSRMHISTTNSSSLGRSKISLKYSFQTADRLVELKFLNPIDVLQRTSKSNLPDKLLTSSLKSAHRLCFVMEYVNGGELFFHLTRERIFSEDRTRFYVAEILLAVEYLHQQGIIYRNLKLENLLLDKDGHIKMADFGLCIEGIGYNDRTDTFCGTPEYLSYEMLISDSYGRQVDWWGLGVVMYEMMVGRLPFYSQDHDELFESILQNEVRCPRTLSSEARSLLSGLLIKEPTKRLGGGPEDANEIKMHPFFVNVNWLDINEKRIEPPFKPQVTSDTDTRYFDEEFTGESVQLTPPPNGIKDNNFDNEENEKKIFNQLSFHGSTSTLGKSIDNNQAF